MPKKLNTIISSKLMNAAEKEVLSNSLESAMDDTSCKLFKAALSENIQITNSS